MLSTRVKAAETRCLIPIMRVIWNYVKARGSETDEWVPDVLDGICSFYEQLDAAGPWQGVWRFLAEYGLENMTTSYQHLSYKFLTSVPLKRLFNEYPNNHFVQHVRLQLRLGCPTQWWCYADQDFMGLIKKVALRCTIATGTHMVILNTVRKLTLGMTYRLAKELRRSRAAP